MYSAVYVSVTCVPRTSRASRWKREDGWVSAGARGGGGCIGENSSRSKYCNIWRDSYEFRVTPPASFYISHVSLLRYFVEILSRIHWAAAASWCARSMGSGKEKGGGGGACVCSGSFLDLHERPFPLHSSPLLPFLRLLLLR